MNKRQRKKHNKKYAWLCGGSKREKPYGVKITSYNQLVKMFGSPFGCVISKRQEVPQHG